MWRERKREGRTRGEERRKYGLSDKRLRKYIRQDLQESCLEKVQCFQVEVGRSGEEVGRKRWSGAAVSWVDVGWRLQQRHS